MVQLKHKIERHFWNNEPDTFMGRVDVFENGMRLWSIATNIDRPNKKDCMADIINLKDELKERHCL